MPTPVKMFKVEPEAKSLPPLRQKLRSLLEAAGFDEKPAYDLLLSLDEVLANVIRHGYGENVTRGRKDKIQVSFLDFGDRAEILIEDKSPCFDPRKAPVPQLPRETPGGLGIHLIRSLTDELHYEALKPVGNRLRLVKYKKPKTN